jgi:transcription initiation factor IIF auxiliary subunit
MLPSFNADSYKITDPLKPSESLPQVSEADFEKGMNIYQGAQRALKLTGAAFDTSRERFTTIGKQAKAFGAGVQAATEFEKVRGNYFDYLNQLETNEQKAIALDISQVKTTTDRNKAVHVKVEMSEKLKQSEIAAEKAQEETKQKQSQLDEFRKQLGQYAKAS